MATRASNGDPQKLGYVESPTHVADPTALSSTLETSGTGGGVHERITGITKVFGDVERPVVIREPVTQTDAPAEVVEGQTTPDLVPPQDPGSISGQQEEQEETEPSAPVAKAPAKRAAAKKTTTSAAAKKPQQ